MSETVRSDKERHVTVTLSPELVSEIWCAVKDARDEAMNLAGQAASAEERLDKLLSEMQAAGMSNWIPTVAEVQTAWAGDGKSSRTELTGGTMFHDRGFAGKK